MGAPKQQEYETWLEAAEASTDLRERELVRLYKTESFDQNQWILLWWLGKKAVDDPTYRMSAREIAARIINRGAQKEVSRDLDESWRTEKSPDTVPARKLVLKVRGILRKIPRSPLGVTVRLPEESHPDPRLGSYFLDFHVEGELDRPLNISPKTVLRPSAKIWERIISPIQPQRGWLVYSNEQPEQPKSVGSTGLYSGTGEVAAALQIGLRTAHLNCDIVPCRSTKFGVKEFSEKRSWYIFLGSPVSNHGMQLLRDIPPWDGLQEFTFDAPAKKNDPPILRKNHATWSKELVPGGHKTATEYALITHLRVGNQVVVAFSGMTTVGTYSAANFFTNDTSIVQLLDYLKIKETDPIPCFEVVIKFSVFDGDHVSAVVEASHIHTR